MEAQSENVHVAHTFFARVGAELYAQSVLSNKISAPELGWNFIKSALSVGVVQCAGKEEEKNVY